MTKKQQPQRELSRRVFDRFMEDLVEADVPVAVVERLRATLLEDGDISEKAIREALFSDEELP